MRFGVCTGLENVNLLAQAGYDYIEPALASTLQPELPESDVMPPLLARLESATLVPETYNVLLPGSLKVVGERVDTARQARYLDTAFERASQLGGLLAVFGSGAARQIPDGFSRDAANLQIREFVRLAGDAAARHGMTVAIEPLNTGECNVLNSVGEAMVLAQAVAHPAVGVLSDLYHILMEGQTYDETRAAGPLLTHVHVAGAENRRAPTPADLELLTGYFRALKAAGYDARVSVEGNWDNLASQAAETLEVLHRAWEAA